jgi:hypothetical protein
MGGGKLCDVEKFNVFKTIPNLLIIISVKLKNTMSNTLNLWVLHKKEKLRFFS